MHVPTSLGDRLGERGSGVLLHPTSLPGPHGAGDLGAAARRFVDFLVEAHQSYWQMLPVGPVGYGNSPYSAQSAFAGSPILIALEPLVERGLLSADDLQAAQRLPPVSPRQVDYASTTELRTSLLRRAFEAGKSDPDFVAYRAREKAWLDDYALFRAIKSAHGEVAWTDWPAGLRDREPKALDKARRELADIIDFRKFEQWLFDGQWRALRAYAAERGIALIGDLPIFVAHDSADVWQHRELFKLDEHGAPKVIAGVPPDYFSTTGQRWGNPLYRWKKLAKTGFRWWVDRFRSALTRFDVVRLDHFIGFQRYWEIPGGEPTAVNGRWMKGPRAPLFKAVKAALGTLPLIAEDLGAVTPAVKKLRDKFELPGIKILQFAFGTDPSAPDFLPYNYPRRAVVYTGTHDNDTVAGWFHEREGGTRSAEQTEKERRAVLEYLGRANGDTIAWDMIRACMASVADTAIFPLQDLLGLGSEGRMNRPGLATGNWEWRFEEGVLTPDLALHMRELSRIYGRNLQHAPTAPSGKG